MRPRLLLRCDAGPNIGYGHVMRSLALAQMLQKDYNVHVCSIALPESLAESVRELGFQRQDIASNKQFIAILEPSDVVVLDGYHFNLEFKDQIKSTNAYLVCIDDLHRKEFHADLLLNHAPGVEASNYRVGEHTKLALGHQYALLNPSFIKTARNLRTIRAINSSLVCFGGADPKNLTRSILEVLLKHPTLQTVQVVTGGAYDHLETLATFLSIPKVQHVHQVSNEEMNQLLAQTDLAIVPASGILFEALATGCLVASGFYVENQRAIYDGFKNLNAFVDLADFTNVELLENISLQHFNNKARGLLDGHSGERIQKLFATSFS